MWFPGILCNGGDHDGHHHHHNHGGGVPATEELTDLIQNFGLAVLGKDQAGFRGSGGGLLKEVASRTWSMGPFGGFPEPFVPKSMP